MDSFLEKTTSFLVNVIVIFFCYISRRITFPIPSLPQIWIAHIPDEATATLFL